MTSMLRGLDDPNWAISVFADEDLPWVASWMNGPPRELAGEIEELAPGFFVVRTKIWLPPSALDSLAELPVVLHGDEPWRRRTDIFDWHTQAACRGEPLAAFFGDDQTGRQPSLHPSVLKNSREKFCAVCPVARACLTWALEKDEAYGIWAGTSGRQRKAMQDLIALSDPADRPVARERLIDQWLAQ